MSTLKNAGRSRYVPFIAVAFVAAFLYVFMTPPLPPDANVAAAGGGSPLNNLMQYYCAYSPFRTYSENCASASPRITNTWMSNGKPYIYLRVIPKYVKPNAEVTITTFSADVDKETCQLLSSPSGKYRWTSVASSSPTGVETPVTTRVKETVDIKHTCKGTDYANYPKKIWYTATATVQVIR